MDDLKILHMDPEVVSKVIGLFKAEFGTKAPLIIRYGRKHDYLGMLLDYSITGKVGIDMSDYITLIVNEAPSDMMGLANTPAASHLFLIDDNASKSGTKEAEQFHHITAQLLLVSKRLVLISRQQWHF